MEIHAWIAIATLVAAMVLFISKLIPLEATALSIPVVLAVTGTVSPAEAALRGFGNGAVIALGAIFVISAGLKESGVATLMGRILERFGGKKEWSLILLIMLSACVLGTFMSNTATVAVILAPVAYSAAESSGVDVGMAFLAVAYGASCAFVLPFAHQCNHMIMGPGGYQTKDFVKVGTGLSIVMAMTAAVLLTL